MARASAEDIVAELDAAGPPPLEVPPVSAPTIADGRHGSISATCGVAAGTHVAARGHHPRRKPA